MYGGWNVTLRRFLGMMNDLSVLRVILKQKSHTQYMKTNKTQSREISLTVDKVWDLATYTWNKIRSSKLTIKIDPI